MEEKKDDERFSRVLGRGSARPARKSFIIFFIIAFFLIFLFNFTQKHTLVDIKEVKIAGQSIKVDLALTKETREKGLSGRENLSNNEGMLFVFENPGEYHFWMKDMNFPIDIIWLAPSEGGDVSEAKVIYIKKYARPELYPETYGPKQNAKYVLEVTSGFSEKNNLKEGDRVQFIY